jgi:hypothetical protein
MFENEAANESETSNRCTVDDSVLDRKKAKTAEANAQTKTAVAQAVEADDVQTIHPGTVQPPFFNLVTARCRFVRLVSLAWDSIGVSKIYFRGVWNRHVDGNCFCFLVI